MWKYLLYSNKKQVLAKCEMKRTNEHNKNK